MARYEKNICLKNIYMLAEKNNLKISELEECGGMSAGFLSRAKNPENKAKLPLEGIVAIAAKLEVPLDIFIGVDMSSISETDNYQLKLLDKLIDETTREILDWKVDTLEYMQTVGDYDYDERTESSGLIGHTLYRYLDEADLLYYNGIADYEEFEDPKPHGNFYHAVIANGIKVYLADVEYDKVATNKKVPAYELWLCSRNKNGGEGVVEGICTTVEAKSFVTEKIKMLHSIIEKNIGSRHLSHNSRKMIDMYVNG